MLKHVDVCVVGGGSAGFGAAVAAARLGAKVLLIERYGFLGGMATIALVHPYQISVINHQLLNGGVFQEVMEELKALKAARQRQLFGQHHLEFDPEILKYVLQEIALASGVELLLHSFLFDVVVRENKIKQVVIANKAGRTTVSADLFIDATGDGDLAAYAQVPVATGREKDQLVQPVSLHFRMGGVDLKKLASRATINRIYQKEKAKGNIQNPRDNVLWFYTTRKGELHFNTTRVNRIDATDPHDLTRAEIESRRQTMEMVNFLKRHVPGFKNAYLLTTGPQVGIRETRRIQGKFILTEQHLLKGARFPDAIARASYPIDIHDPKTGGTRWQPLPKGVFYEIPYRSLLPQRIQNLLVAGRPISCTHEAFSSIRVMPTSMTTGQAAGVAAVLSLKEKKTPDRVDPRTLREHLLKQGACL